MDQKELMQLLEEAQNAPVSYVDLKMATQRIKVDMDTRRITGYTEFGVIKDHLAENIIFEVKRYKGDTDLAEKHCAIHWENGKNGGVVPVTEIDLSEDGHILMRWELSDEFTQYAGSIAYALHFFSILDGGFTYHAATNAAVGTLGTTLNASAHSKNKITPSEIEVYIAKMNELSAAMDEQVVLAQEAATKAESIAEQLAEKIAKVEELTQKTEINKNDISKLSGEIDDVKGDLDNIATYLGYDVPTISKTVIGAYEIGRGYTNVVDRLRIVIDVAPTKFSYKLKYNKDKIYANYFVVQRDDVSKLLYSQNIWNETGEILVENLQENCTIIFVFKKINGSMFYETDLAEYTDYISIIITAKKIVDIFMFMGQSNMAGRGITNDNWIEHYPTLIDNAGYEFRAISNPTILYPISEPFGVNENKIDGIDDGNKKTGSMVTSFVNAYYKKTGIPIVGVSASKGGSSIADWQPKNAYLTDAIQRFLNCVTYLEDNGYAIRHKFILWCQGETDGDIGTIEEDYKTMFQTMLKSWLDIGIEKLFMVRIGNCNVENEFDRYSNVIKWQNDIAQSNKDVVMVSTAFAGMRERGLMKDDFHYYQAGYNEVGYYAGVNTAFYVNNGKEPTMYDTEYNNLYFSKKN